MVSVPESRSRGLGSSPGQVVVLCSWERHFTLTVPLSTHAWDATCDGLASQPVEEILRSLIMLNKLGFDWVLLISHWA